MEGKDMQLVAMPAGAEILTVQAQRDTPCIWALVDVDSPPATRMIETFGTGHEVYEDMGVDRKCLGTYQLRGGALVFHVFERIN